MSDVTKIIKELGAPLVKEAFDELLSNNICSPTAMKIIRRFSKKWKDYSRPALMIMACEAVGGEPAQVHPAAKALILIGGGFDIHDDIVDASYVRTKRRRKSVLGMYGTSAALLVGDALLIGGLGCLHELWTTLPREKAATVVEAIKCGLFELGSAEMEELRFVRNINVTTKQYLRIVRMKAADVEAYTRVGAMIGGGSESEVEALARFGRLLGMIAILRDDIEDTFYDDYELEARITKESLPFPIICTLKDPECRTLLQKMFQSLERGDLDRLKANLKENESMEKTKEVINLLIRKAKKEANRVKYPSRLIALFEGQH